MTLTDNPSLLDVVPWRYGFGHTWALRWLLSHPDIAPRVLAAVADWPAGRHGRIVDGPNTEQRYEGVRADLGFVVEDGAGRREPVALETKVEDMFNEEQIDGYRRAGRTPLMYMPGLTGFLVADNICKYGELHLTADALADALDGVQLPWMLASYVEAVRQEAARFRQALDQVIATGKPEPTQGHTAFEALKDVAWVNAVSRGLRERAPSHGLDPELTLRAEANDRGFFWDGSWVTMPELSGTDEVGLYIDVLAPVRTNEWIVAVKVGGKKGTLAEIFHHARDSGPPTDDPRWRRGAARVGGESVTVYSARMMGAPVADAVELTLLASEWIQHVRAAALCVTAPPATRSPRSARTAAPTPSAPFATAGRDATAAAARQGSGRPVSGYVMARAYPNAGTNTDVT